MRLLQWLTSIYSYLICLTIGPAFLTASIYLCLSRIIIVYGARISRFAPATISTVFMVSDFISLVLQAAGGALSSTADDKKSSDHGRYIMIAGLAWQVLSLGIFMLVWADFLLRLRRADESQKDARLSHVRTGTRRFVYFQYAVWLATILIFIRSVYRVVELQGGFHGTVASDEPSFMVLEGPMIFLAVLALTVLHPGYAFAGNWKAASWSFRSNKNAEIDMMSLK